MGENVIGYRYIAHLYCLAVQAAFYSDVVECSLSTRENLVRSRSGKKEFFFACYICMVHVGIIQRCFHDASSVAAQAYLCQTCLETTNRFSHVADHIITNSNILSR